MHNLQNTYLEGWYSITDLKRVIETAERINEVNEQMADEAAQKLKTQATESKS